MWLLAGGFAALGTAWWPAAAAQRHRRLRAVAGCSLAPARTQVFDQQDWMEHRSIARYFRDVYGIDGERTRRWDLCCWPAIVGFSVHGIISAVVPVVVELAHAHAHRVCT